MLLALSLLALVSIGVTAGWAQVQKSKRAEALAKFEREKNFARCPFCGHNLISEIKERSGSSILNHQISMQCACGCFTKWCTLGTPPTPVEYKKPNSTETIRCA